MLPTPCVVLCRSDARPASAPATLRLPPAACQRGGHRGGVRRGRGGGRGRHEPHVPWRLDQRQQPASAGGAAVGTSVRICTGNSTAVPLGRQPSRHRKAVVCCLPRAPTLHPSSTLAACIALLSPSPSLPLYPRSRSSITTPSYSSEDPYEEDFEDDQPDHHSRAASRTHSRKSLGACRCMFTAPGEAPHRTSYLLVIYMQPPTPGPQCRSVPHAYRLFCRSGVHPPSS